MSTYTGQPTTTDAELAALKAKWARMNARMGFTETADRYLDRTAHLVDPNPTAGTDWDGIL